MTESADLEIAQIYADREKEPYSPRSLSVEELEVDEDCRDENSLIDEDIDRGNIFEKIISDLTEKQRKVIMGYLEGKTQAEIAAECGISQQAVSEVYKRSLEILKENPLASALWDQSTVRRFPVKKEVPMESADRRTHNYKTWKLRKHYTALNHNFTVYKIYQNTILGVANGY